MLLAGHIRLTLRHLAKYRLYACINITGLSLGLTLFLFSSMLVLYQRNHDHMFPLRDRIFSVSSVFASTSDRRVSEFPSVRSSYGPLFKAEIAELQRVARVIHRQRLITADGAHYHMGIRFAEPDFTRIFDFQYIQGSPAVLDDGRGLILTRGLAQTLFGRTHVMGQTITLEHQVTLVVGAVIEDIAGDSHFNASLIPNFELGLIAPLKALTELEDFNPDGEWQTLLATDMTYLLLPQHLDRAWLQTQVEAVSARHAPKNERDHIAALKVRPLAEANIVVWETLGFPLLESIQILGLLILIIASVNYTNLATAMGFGRSREIGLRKVFGAEPVQLLSQFLIESLTISCFAMCLTTVAVELLVPAYNYFSGHQLSIHYPGFLARMLLTTLTLGLLAGAYPAYLITRPTPLDGLRNNARWGNSRLRGLMITLQFSISTFMLAVVLIIFFQNQKIISLSWSFPKSQILVLEGLNNPSLKPKRDALIQGWTAIDGVQTVAFSNTVPFAEMDNARFVTPQHGEPSAGFKMNMVAIDFNFMTAYDMQISAGRGFQSENPADVFNNQREDVHVIINEMAARKLGFTNNHQALGRSFYKIPDSQYPVARKYIIIGVKPNQYFLGLQTHEQPICYLVRPDHCAIASIRLNGENSQQTQKEIQAVWGNIAAGYPIRQQGLNEVFNYFYSILKTINTILAVMTLVALFLPLIGLFGLTALTAQRRTKEIGIRKVMGAEVSELVPVLIWEFSKPVFWSLFITAPSAWFASDIYLNFFPERISFVAPLILLASVLSLVTSWMVVAGHAVMIANTSPIHSLRVD